MIVEVVWNYIVFALLHTVIGAENSRYLLDQSYANQEPITTWSPAFSRALGIWLFLLWVLIGS